MSSRSGGSGNKKKMSYGGPSTSSSTGNNSPLASSAISGKDTFVKRSADLDENGFLPLETRMIEIRDGSGNIKQVPALDKRWVPSTMECIEFYLPSCEHLLQDETALLNWLDQIDMYCEDLKWLLSVPHHEFWSTLMFSPEVSHLVLNSFLSRAPQFFDQHFEVYLHHEVIGPKYQEVYSLVFRVFMRICTFRESKKDFISSITWASLLVDHQILDILKLFNLCTLYGSENNALLPKMIDNVMKNCPKLVSRFRNSIPILLSKSKDMTDELRDLIRESSATRVWDLATYEDHLSLFLSTTTGLYKFIKVYTPAAETVMKFPSSLIKLASTYEPNCCNLWTQVIAHLPSLHERVNVLRVLLIRLFRTALAKPTIDKVTASNDQRIDEYFEVITHCLDEKTFIRDYEKAYPFKQDINAMLSRGVFIDETRIDYIANAISSCFNACGEEYAVEKIVVDPLYDPNFDRQLLGACSLDVTGVELQSLVSQVKDILPEQPDSYVEVVLKHYSYQTEAAINALLEGSVPTRLEKYKNETYVKNAINSTGMQQRPGGEDTELEKLASKKLVIKDVGVEAERFYSGKRRYGFEEESRGSISIDKAVNPKTKELVAKMQEESVSAQLDNNPYPKVKKSVRLSTTVMEDDGGIRQERYIDESLLPSIRDSAEYDDEYDDTYDEYSVGMTEPDNVEIKPLNQKKMQAVNNDPESDDEDSGKESKKHLDFCEDPAIIRARLERKREDKQQHHHHQRRGNGPPPSNDVVGRGRGQGQEKDVLYARRQKNINKDQGGFKKKRSDFKRREF